MDLFLTSLVFARKTLFGVTIPSLVASDDPWHALQEHAMSICDIETHKFQNVVENNPSWHLFSINVDDIFQKREFFIKCLTEHVSVYIFSSEMVLNISKNYLLM